MRKNESFAGRRVSPPPAPRKRTSSHQAYFLDNGTGTVAEPSMFYPTLWLSRAITRAVLVPVSPKRTPAKASLSAPFRYTPQGHLPGSGDSSGGGPCAQCIGQGEAAPAQVSQSASGHSPLPSPVPAGNGHRLGERARNDSKCLESRGHVCSFHSSIEYYWARIVAGTYRCPINTWDVSEYVKE